MIDNKLLQKMMSYARRAVDTYGMIQDGDRIALGISGGKDSLALLCALDGLSKYYPKSFTVVPINIKMGFPDEDSAASAALCAELGLTLHCFESDIYSVVFEIRKEKSPCSLCANMRRGALHDAAKKLSCNKLALGHHFDDAVETLVMNLFIGGRFDCFRPVTYLSRRDLTVIRPLLYAPEKEISRFVRASGIVTVPKRCPADGMTKREEAKNALAALEKTDRGVKRRLFGALERGLFIDGNQPNKLICPSGDDFSGNAER